LLENHIAAIWYFIHHYNASLQSGISSIITMHHYLFSAALARTDKSAQRDRILAKFSLHVEARSHINPKIA
jgi:hypothetical protein